MQRFLLLFIVVFLSQLIWAGVIHGVVLDENNAPMPFASVYVKNSTYGTSTDLKGTFFLELKKGEYEVVFSFVGYNSKTIKVNVGERTKTYHKVELQPNLNELNAVEVVSNARNLAKEVMQNARAQRNFYDNQIQDFKCKTYLKTSLEKELKNKEELDSVAIKNAEALSLDNFYKKEKLNLIEYISITYFKKSNQWKEEIDAFHDFAEMKAPSQRGASVGISIGESDIAPVVAEAENPYILYEDMRSSDLNFYDNLIHFPSLSKMPLLSPLAATSGLSYQFDLEGSFYENNVKIYKIKVKPIFITDPLFYGTIYIQDSTWALLSVDLFVNKAALNFCKEFHVIQNYEEIQKNVYLPTRREMNYVISDGKHNVIGNTRIQHTDYEVNIGLKNSDFDNEIKIFSPLAFDRDTSFWQTNRPIKLKDAELKFINETDSIREYFESPEYLAKQDSSFNKINFWSILNGVGHRNRVRGTEWYISGIFEQMNFFGIGGYRHKLPGYFQKEFKNNHMVEARGFVDYGFNNKDVKGKLGIGYTYMPLKFMRTFIEVGDYYDMINDFASIQQTFSRSNYVRNLTFSVAQKMEIINGLYAELTFAFSDQAPINNLQLENWSNELFGTLNTPVDFERYIKSELRLELKYRYKQKFYIKKNKKIILGSKYPELSLLYRKGLPNLFGSEVDFDFFEIMLRDDKNIARWGTMRWDFRIGSFLNRNNLRILEHKYFRGSDNFFFSDPLRSFQLLGPTLSTPNSYLKMSGIHHFEGALANKIPYFNRLKVHFAAGTGFLSIPENDFYHAEVFAGLERVFRIKKQLFRIGAYAVTADNSVSEATFTYKFGISFYNTFTKKYDY